VRWPAARITAPDQRATTRLLVFAAFELVLAMAIPFILIRGYHTLLSSNTGTFVEGPTIEEPGWSALVSATPLTAVVEVVDGEVSGATLIVPAGQVPADDDESEDESGADRGPVGGTIVLIPGDLSIPATQTAGSDELDTSPTRLSDVAAADAGSVLEALLNVDLASIHTIDETVWTRVLSGTTYDLDNPDPVPTARTADVTGEADDGPDELAFAVGPVAVDGAGAAVFLGRPVDGGSLSSVMPRRRQFWSAMIEYPPASDHPVVSAIRAVGAAGQIVELPTAVDSPDAPVIDGAAAEELLRDVVAFPSGNRLEIRVVDRSGDADLRSIAAQLAGRGIEVVEIANAMQFDGGSTELIQPADLAGGVEQFDDLIAELNVEPIVDPEQERDTVTLLVGNDFRLAD